MNPTENKDQQLREQLVNHIKGGNAFATVEKIAEEVPFEKTGVVPDGLPYSFYQQFYHLWIAQKDIIDYCLMDDYQHKNWPDDYWPDEPAPQSESEWQALVQTFFEERNRFCNYLLDGSNDLYDPFPANKNHNLLREAELLIEHNAYHIGQLYVIARLSGSYPS